MLRSKSSLIRNFILTSVSLGVALTSLLPSRAVAVDGIPGPPFKGAQAEGQTVIGTAHRTKEDAARDERFRIWFDGGDDNVAPPAHLCDPKAPPPLANLVKPKGPEVFKSEADLARYIECHLVHPNLKPIETCAMEDRFKKYQAEYAPLLKAAAMHFDIPVTLLTCLIFRESRFDPNAKSSSGALSFPQALPSTLRTVQSYIRPPSPKEHARYTDVMTGTLDEMIKRRGVTRSMAIKERVDAKEKFSNWELGTRWNNYFEDIKSRGLPSNGVKLTKQSKIPRDLNPTTIKDPATAFGFAAMYLRDILTHVQSTVDKNTNVSTYNASISDKYVTLTATGLYNRGPGAAKALRGVKPVDAAAWVQILKGNDSKAEIFGHLESIERCITPPSKNAQIAWRGPTGSHNVSCTEPRKPDAKCEAAAAKKLQTAAPAPESNEPKKKKKSAAPKKKKKSPRDILEGRQ